LLPRKNLFSALLLLCCLSGQLLWGVAADSPAVAAKGGDAAAAVPAPTEKKGTGVSRFFKDEIEIWTAPFNLDLKSSLLFAGVLAGAGVIIANDEGIYKAINAETADVLSKNFTYINRESDLGVAGLREAKMRYHPHHMVEVFSVKKHR